MRYIRHYMVIHSELYDILDITWSCNEINYHGFYVLCSWFFLVIGWFWYNSMKLNNVRELLWHMNLIECKTQIHFRENFKGKKNLNTIYCKPHFSWFSHHWFIFTLFFTLEPNYCYNRICVSCYIWTLSLLHSVKIFLNSSMQFFIL